MSPLGGAELLEGAAELGGLLPLSGDNIMELRHRL